MICTIGFYHMFFKPFQHLGMFWWNTFWLDLIWCDLLGLSRKFPIRDLPQFLRIWVRRLHGKKWQKPSQVFLGQFLYCLFWLRMICVFFLNVFFRGLFACLMVCWIVCLVFLHVASGFFVGNITRVMLHIVGWMSEKLLISKKLKLAYHPGSEPDLS